MDHRELKTLKCCCLQCYIVVYFIWLKHNGRYRTSCSSLRLYLVPLKKKKVFMLTKTKEGGKKENKKVKKLTKKKNKKHQNKKNENNHNKNKKLILLRVLQHYHLQAFKQPTDMINCLFLDSKKLNLWSRDIYNKKNIWEVLLDRLLLLTSGN